MRCRHGFKVVYFLQRTNFLIETFLNAYRKKQDIIFNNKQVFFNSKLVSTQEGLFFLQ